MNILVSLIFIVTFCVADQLEEFETALMKNDLAMAQQLLEKGFNPNAEFNKVKETPLTLAALNCNVPLIRILLNHGARVNHRAGGGWTALMFASRGAMERGGKFKENPACIETVSVLLKKSADKTLENNEGKTAYEIAKSLGHQKITEKLKQLENDFLG